MAARLSVLPVAVLAALSSGCLAGPAYERPALPVPASYRSATSPGVAATASIGEQAWWDLVQDDVLRGLIRTALEQNHDVRIAAARVAGARAMVGIVHADELPMVNAGA